jgi:hypothetical protein
MRLQLTWENRRASSQPEFPKPGADTPLSSEESRPAPMCALTAACAHQSKVSSGVTVAISMFDQTVSAMSRMLLNLDAIVSRAEKYAEEKKIDPDVLIQARLYPDMLPFVAQIRIATDMAKGAAARLSGAEMPKWPDDEVTFDDIHARIRKALNYLAGFKPEQFEGSETKNVELKLPNRTLQFTGRNYVLGFVLPNFYFHATTAYNILRHNGLDLGKLDFMGAPE